MHPYYVNASCFLFACLLLFLFSCDLHVLYYIELTRSVFYLNARLSSLRTFLFLCCNHWPKAYHVVRVRAPSGDIAQHAPMYT